MKIVYCISALHNSAGMERIITEKANYLAENGHDITILTAEQQGKPIYYPLNNRIIHRDLGINYSEHNSIIKKTITYFFKRRKHKKRISEFLYSERPDIVISTMGNELFFLHSIKDGSKKIAEIHFTRYYRILNHRKFPWNIIDRLRCFQERLVVSKYDRFVVLTNEDALNWPSLNNLTVIPNFIAIEDSFKTDITYNRLISVGRLVYQKGYDRLIEACKLIRNSLENKWTIDIYGAGELHDQLQTMIEDAALGNIIKIHHPVKDIKSQIIKSDGILFTSRFEGFSMVLLEAMACGIPAVSFDAPCGPKDIIDNGQDGLLVQNGNVEIFAKALLRFIRDKELRSVLSKNARNKALQYERSIVMNKWITLFNDILK